MKDRTTKHYADPKHMENQRDVMKEHYADPKHMETQRDVMKDRMKEHYAYQKNMETQRDLMKDRMKEHYAVPKNMETQRDAMKDRMKEHYAEPTNMEKQRDVMKDRMKEHDAHPKNREKHQNYMKERIISNRPQGSIESDDNNEISSADENLLASLNVEKCKSNCLKAIRNSTRIPGKHTHKSVTSIFCDQFIIEREKICWTSIKLLLDNDERLGVGRYENI